MSRFVAVGDVHGCARTFELLIERLRLGPGDTLLMLGDLVSKGMDSKGVVQQLMAVESSGVNVILIAGNHELMLLAMQRELGKVFDLPYLPDGVLSDAAISFFVRDNGTWSILKSYGLPGVDEKNCWLFGLRNRAEVVAEVVDAVKSMPWHLPQDHLEFIAASRPYHIERNCLFVHAGVHPAHLGCPTAAAAMEAQLTTNPSDLCWNRDWLGTRPNFSELIVHGHTPLPCLYTRVADTDPWKDDDLVFRSTVHDGALNLDSGVFMDSGHLTAVEITESGAPHEFQFIRVPRIDPVEKDPLWYVSFT